MAELNTGGSERKGKKVRSKKQNSGVDLTAMVDLAFLLITFFMLTTSMSKPQSMNLAMPEKSDDNQPETETKSAESRTMTILLGADDKIMWYLGKEDAPLEGPSDQTYGMNGIRQVLLQKIKEVPQKAKDPEKFLVVVIKLSENTHYKNLVDILDEMAITGVRAYSLGEITEGELQILGEG